MQYSTHKFLPHQFFILIVIVLLMAACQALYAARIAPIIIDHTCSDLSLIPDSWIENARQNIRIFHASTSHGMQPIEGMSRLETGAAKYSMAYDWSLPTEANSLCILHQSWYEPELFFTGAQSYLDANSAINVAMYFWCGQTSDYDVNKYISAIEALEAANPKVTFVYTTGNAQENDCAGCGRHRFNEALRKYCREHNKVLFDFADMDVWYNGEMNTYESPNWCVCVGQSIPLQHPQYNGDEAYHTTFESCEIKGKAFWWMLAAIAGWESPTPVKMSLIKASFQGQYVALNWKAIGGTSYFGFNVFRSKRKEGPFAQINDRLIEAKGSSVSSGEYAYKDEQRLSSGIYFYRIQQIGTDGTITLSEPVSVQVGNGLPKSIQLNQNYPNPFNSSTAISFYLPKSQFIVLDILSVTGERMTTLLNANKTPGLHSVSWNGKNANGVDVPSGIYVCRILAGELVTTRRIVLIR